MKRGSQILLRAMAGHVRRFPAEAAIWAVGLIVMAAMDPATDGETWCVFARMGIEWCPGCGLGHAIALLARGEWAASFAAHPLGGVVVAGLTIRILDLIRGAYTDSPFALPAARN
ncbi:MAG: DUF2752 domain-containing protein [Bacteroidetes bacterium]|nr:DUF2752 domain-containing protein [Bacteroidota bacterium]